MEAYRKISILLYNRYWRLTIKFIIIIIIIIANIIFYDFPCCAVVLGGGGIPFWGGAGSIFEMNNFGLSPCEINKLLHKMLSI